MGVIDAGTPQNLAIKFVDDTIDETDRLTQLLQNDAAVAATLNLTVRSLPGDHVRPLRQEVGNLPCNDHELPRDD